MVAGQGAVAAGDNVFVDKVGGADAVGQRLGKGARSVVAVGVEPFAEVGSRVLVAAVALPILVFHGVPLPVHGEPVLTRVQPARNYAALDVAFESKPAEGNLPVFGGRHIDASMSLSAAMRAS